MQRAYVQLVTRQEDCTLLMPGPTYASGPGLRLSCMAMPSPCTSHRGLTALLVAAQMMAFVAMMPPLRVQQQLGSCSRGLRMDAG